MKNRCHQRRLQQLLQEIERFRNQTPMLQHARKMRVEYEGHSLFCHFNEKSKTLSELLFFSISIIHSNP